MKTSNEKRGKRTFAAMSRDVQKSLTVVQSREAQQRSRQSKQFPKYSPNDDDDDASGNLCSRSSSGCQSSCCSSLSDSGEEDSRPQGEAFDSRPFPLIVARTLTPTRPTCLSTRQLNLKIAADQEHSASSSIFLLSSDVMADVLSFLNPVEVLKTLTSPLCKDWCERYTHNHDLWRVLCCVEPFNLKKSDDLTCSSDNDSSYCSLKSQPVERNKMGRHRLMYTSFVRCMRYLKQIKEGSTHGNSLVQSRNGPFGESRDLKEILAGRNNLVAQRASLSKNPARVLALDGKKQADRAATPSRKPKYAASMITSRLLGPSSEGAPSHLRLPQSCAIFSIVNWMVAYSEVEGIQIMCLEALPSLLEDERHRLTAQRASLAEVVLKAMMLYPNTLKLHVAAMHAIVLLGRPLGGQEGMLIDLMERPMALGGLGFVDRGRDGRTNRVCRINVVLKAMRRFEDEEKLQAMACWALVNLALVPTQKTMLMKLGGIEATLSAMRKHPNSPSVQFRGLFALINLSIPCKDKSHSRTENNNISMPKSEKEILDGHAAEIVNLAVSAVQNFHSSRTIRNRACLVLHNISLSRDYIPTLLWTRHCYRMLEWCAANETSDQVLCRSAVGALRRLQDVLSRNESLSARFVLWMLTEQKLPNPLVVCNAVAGEEGRHI